MSLLQKSFNALSARAGIKILRSFADSSFVGATVSPSFAKGSLDIVFMLVPIHIYVFQFFCYPVQVREYSRFADARE